jgi:L-fuconolactonase
MKIDAHQHFWKFDPVRDAWISEDMAVIRRDFYPEDLQPVLEAAGMDGCVAVQADQSLQETRFLLDLAAKHDFIKAVVGWVDLCADDLEEHLGKLEAEQKLAGFRHIIQAEPPAFFSRTDFRNGIRCLGKHDFTFDILIFPQHLPEALSFVKAFPNQKFVIDHLAKPHIKAGSMKEWRPFMQEMAQCDNVWVKLSGMVTEADWKAWKQEDMRPYLDVLLEHFGPSRLMYGSDWPVCLLAADYQRQMAVVVDYISSLSEPEQALIMGNNAREFYGISND